MLNSISFLTFAAVLSSIGLVPLASANVLPRVDIQRSAQRCHNPPNTDLDPQHMSIGASQIRIQISNTFGTTPLPITNAAISQPASGKAGAQAIQPTTIMGVTFNGGSESVSIPAGKVVYTDPIDYTVAPLSELTLTMYLAKGQSGNSITGHPGSRTTTWMQAGSDVNMTSVTGGSTKHWYFVTGVEAWAPSNSSAFVILGDSITDGRGSDDDSNNRWPDLVLAKMQASPATQNIGVVNEAAGGNCVLSGGLGPPLMTRYTRDGITQQGVKYIMIFEGVNDIGSGASDTSLIAAFKQIAADARKAGILVFGATITPLGTSYYSASREAIRQKVNKWIMASGGVYDAAVDFDAIVRDSSNPSQLASKYNSGDGLHPNVAGYQAIANAFPLDIFSKAAPKRKL
ncbi:hypothetical protein LSUE1_G003171 [Lachnellula suecica]|uniref:SGNH hydrolase-type esterase domain-containing protein n=1 Tax=Lachnellula suecica TaxID=602035 RepID=A0A8T9C5Z6_9HELO|nr:hypothetical protein LSUE1_G003171 [Lachnellula suecica]